MPATIACPKCQTKYKLPDSALGKPIKCQKCGASFRTQARASQPQPSSQRPSGNASPQPNEQELARYGIEGALKRQADIFSAPPPPPRANPLGNFVLEDPGFADIETARREVLEEEGQSDGMEAIISNPYARGGKIGKKSNLPDIDFTAYAVARVGMWMVFVSWAILLSCMVLLYLTSWLVRLAPEFMGNMAESIGPAIILGLYSTLLGLMSLSLGIAFIGQIICIFSPNKDEKLFAGLAVGALVGAVVLPIIGFFIGALGAFGAEVSGSEAVDSAAGAVVGLVMLVFLVAAYLLALSNMFCFITYFQRVGTNIRSNDVTESAKLAMTTWIAAIVAAILCSIAAFVLVAIYTDEQPEWYSMAINLIGLVNAILGFAVMGTLIAMVKTAIEKTKAT